MTDQETPYQKFEDLLETTIGFAQWTEVKDGRVVQYYLSSNFDAYGNQLVCVAVYNADESAAYASGEGDDDDLELEDAEDLDYLPKQEAFDYLTELGAI